MSHKLIVVDSDHPLARQNQCFDPKYEYLGFGYALNVRLAREAAKRKIEILTADKYLDSPKDIHTKVVCLTDMVTRFTEPLLASGAQPSVCFSLESPLIARKFYHNMAKYAGRFHHNFQFSGTRERLENTGTTFHPIIFPMESRVPEIDSDWKSRSYVILINSNKRAAFNRWDSLKNITHTVISQIYFFILKTTDPWMRIREIYIDRIEAIRYFSDFQDFSLYGIGWDKPIHGFGKPYQVAVSKSYKGIIPSDVRIKRKTLSGFKFALCFENCIFPGYITEKIFDCFLAGCIPVYYGAPDITDHIPSDTFIDYRKFGSFEELDCFLRKMTESDAKEYIQAAKKFLSDSSFDKLTVDYFVNDIINVLEKEFQDNDHESLDTVKNIN